MEGTINRVLELLGLEKPSAENLTAQLRHRKKVGQEEKVAAVMLTATLLERFDYDRISDQAASVPIPLALPPQAVRPVDAERRHISDSDRRIIETLVMDVVNAVTLPFLLRMLQTFTNPSKVAKDRAYPIHRSALILLWEISSRTLTDPIFDRLEPCLDVLLSVAFASSDNSIPVPQESVERILLIFKNVCAEYVQRMHMHADASTAGHKNEIYTKVSSDVAKLLHRSVKFCSPFPTLVLRCVVEIFNNFHSSYHRFSETECPNWDDVYDDSCAQECVRLALAVSLQTSFCLRQLVIQGLHGYASDRIRDTTFMACYFLLKESVDLFRDFEMSSPGPPIVKYRSLVPILWSVEPDDGMEDVSRNRSKSSKSSNGIAGGSTSDAAIAPVGQFSVLLCGVVQIELRLLFQQALSTFHDLREFDPDGDLIEEKTKKQSKSKDPQEAEERIQRMLFLLLSLFDLIIILLVGENNDSDGDDNDNETVWSGLPRSVIGRIRQHIDSVIHDMFEFINEAAVMIQAQNKPLQGVASPHQNTGLEKLIKACCRVGRSLSLWLSEDDSLLDIFLSGRFTISGKSDKNLSIFIDSILSCSYVYHALIDSTSEFTEKQKDMACDDGHKRLEIVYNIDTALHIAQMLSGMSLISEPKTSKFAYQIGAENEPRLTFARYADDYDESNIDINYALGQGDILQFFLPVFLSVTQSESQIYQEGKPEQIILLTHLNRQGCEFSQNLLKLVLVALFISQSTYAEMHTSVSRLYTTGSMACDQLSLLLEHFMTEHTGCYDESHVLGVSIAKWSAFYVSVNKALVAERKLRDDLSDAAKAHTSFMTSLDQLKATIDLLSRFCNFE